MKAFIILAALAFVCVKGATEEENQRFELIKGCIRETGIAVDAAKKVTIGNISSNDRNIPCFLNCYFERSGATDRNGVPQRDVILQQWMAKDPTSNRAELDILADKCIQVKGVDRCDAAFQLYECYWSTRRH